MWPKTSFFNSLRLSFLNCKEAETCFLVLLRGFQSNFGRPGRAMSTTQAHQAYSFLEKNHSLPCKTPFSLLRPTPSPYSVTGLITLLTHVPLPRPPPHSSSWPGHFPGTGRGPDSTRQTGTVISWRGLGMGVQKAKNLGKS